MITLKNKCYFFLLIITVIFAIYFRSIGGVVMANDLWADEVIWLKRLYKDNIFSYKFRPIGFMILSKIIINISIQYHTSLARVLSFLPSVLTLLLFTKLALQRFNNKTVIYFVVFSFSLSPYLITFAKEFKPYSLEILIFTYLLFSIHKISRTDFVSTTFILSLNFIWIFAYNSLFVYPLLFPYLVIKIVKSPRKLILLSLSALFTISASIWLKGCISKNIALSTSSSYWGRKYGVFHFKENAYDIFKWYLDKTYELSKLISVHTFIPIEYSVYYFSNFLLIALVLCGLFTGVINKNNRTLAIASVAPVVIIMLLNIFRIWPYGGFRTNLFLIPGLFILAGFGANSLINIKLLKIPSQIILVLFIITHLPYKISFFSLKRPEYWTANPHTSELVIALKKEAYLAKQRNEKMHLILDWHTYEPLSLHVLKQNQDKFGIKSSGLEKSLIIYRGGVNSSTLVNTYNNTLKKLKSSKNCPSQIFAVITKIEANKPFINFLSRKIDFVEKTIIPSGTYDKIYHPVMVKLSHSCPMNQ